MRPGLHVKGISYNKTVLGDAVVKSRWVAENKAITLDAEIDQEKGRRSFAKVKCKERCGISRHRTPDFDKLVAPVHVDALTTKVPTKNGPMTLLTQNTGNRDYIHTGVSWKIGQTECEVVDTPRLVLAMHLAPGQRGICLRQDVACCARLSAFVNGADGSSGLDLTTKVPTKNGPLATGCRVLWPLCAGNHTRRAPRRRDSRS